MQISLFKTQATYLAVLVETRLLSDDYFNLL